MLREHELDQVSGASADGHSWLDDAERMLRSSALHDENYKASYILAYDAARSALTSLLIQQGLRPTSKGGHYCVAQAVIAQFGEGFRLFESMRRRRNEIEYPQMPTEVHVTSTEVGEALKDTRYIIESAQQLIDQIGLF
jgi:uncharacterized protein (UPF0332 family)